MTPALDMSTFDRVGNFSRKSSSCAKNLVSPNSAIEDSDAKNGYTSVPLRDILAKIHSASPFKKNAQMLNGILPQKGSAIAEQQLLLQMQQTEEHSLWNANVSPITQVNDETMDDAKPAML